MKFKSLILLMLPFLNVAHAQGIDRPIAASQINNGAGVLYIPTSTPFGNRVCVFDPFSTVSASVTTSDELAFVHGATSNIQAQINALVVGTASRNTNTVGSNFTFPTLVKDYLLNVNTSSGGIIVILPDAVDSLGYCADVKNIGSPVNSITVSAFDGQTIDGFSNVIINDPSGNESRHFCAVNGNWYNY